MLGVKFDSLVYDELIEDEIALPGLLFVTPLNMTSCTSAITGGHYIQKGWRFCLKLTENEKVFLLLKYGDVIDNWEEWDEGEDEDWHV